MKFDLKGKSWDELEKEGLVRIIYKKAPSGNYKILPDNKIQKKRDL